MRLHLHALTEAIESTAQRCWAAQRAHCAADGLPIIPTWWDLHPVQRAQTRGAVTATAVAVAALESAAYDELHPAHPVAATAALAVATRLERALTGPPADNHHGTCIPLDQLDTEPGLQHETLLIAEPLPLLTTTALPAPADTAAEAWAARALIATAGLLRSFGHPHDAETLADLAQGYLTPTQS